MQSNHGDTPHKFIRIKSKIGVSQQYRCAKDGCPTIIHYEIIIGRIGECWRCKRPFTITKRTLRNKYLHCVDCTHTKSVESKGNTIDSLLDGIFNLPTTIDEMKDGDRK